MQAHISLRIGPAEDGRVENDQKSNHLFSKVSRFITKSVSYYQDEDLKKAGSPYIWTE